VKRLIPLATCGSSKWLSVLC